MHNKRWILSIASVLAGLIAITGCSSPMQEPGPKTTTLAALNELSQANSYEFNKTILLNELSTNVLLTDTMEESEWIFSFLNNSKINIAGTYQKEPLRIEMNLDFNSYNETPYDIQMPIVMTEDKTYIKIPELPSLSFPPTEYKDKYVEIDNVNNPTHFNPNKLIETEQAIFSKTLSQFDENTNFKKTNKRSSDIPLEIEADQVITFSVNEDTFDQLAVVLVNDVLPKFLELLSTAPDEHHILDKNEIIKLKQALTQIQKTDIQAWIDGLKKSFKLNDFHITTAIDKAGYIRYQETIANMAFLNGNDFFKLDMVYSEQYNKLNEPVQFTMSIPTKNNIIKEAELNQILNDIEYKPTKLESMPWDE